MFQKGNLIISFDILGVLVSYRITRGVKLIVGRVIEEVKGVLWEFWGGLGRSGGVKGGLLDPFRTHFASLEAL